MSRSLSICKILLLVVLLMVLSGALACGGGSPGTGTTTNPVNPTGQTTTPADNPVNQIANSPLTVLSVAGGNVLVLKTGDSEWRRGEAGMVLDVNDRVKTEAGSLATITFFEGTTIELNGDTVIKLTELIAGEQTTIKIKQELGQTVSRVKKLVDAKSSYEIETTAAVALVRGTILSVGVTSNGITTVGNIEGLVSVIAQGIEVKLPEGTHNIVLPGQPPGQPQPGTTPPPTTTTQTTEPVPTTTKTTTTTETSHPGITISQTVGRDEAYPGDTVNLTYTVANSGDVSLSDIVIDDNADPVYKSGDTNGNNILDLEETWLFSSSYFLQAFDMGYYTNTAMVSGISPGKQQVTASSQLTVHVIPIAIEVTSIKPGETYGQDITVAGTVNDLSIKEAVITVNGNPNTIPVINGTFSTNITLNTGVTTTITITVAKPGGISAMATFDMVPVTTQT